MDIEIVRATVQENAKRIKELGNWPAHVDESSLTSRIPGPWPDNAPGFDAGIACCLDLIPRDKQRLSAILHAAYTPEAIEQVRREVTLMEAYIAKFEDPDDIVRNLGEHNDPSFNTETVWWLAACRMCTEDSCNEDDVSDQVQHFIEMSKLPEDLYLCAYEEYKSLEKSYHVVDGVAVALKDGGMQAAYIHGYPLAVMPAYGTWFVGTYHPSLGLRENIIWSDKKDEKGRAMSGPVFGSKQFVKCATFDELADVIFCAKRELKM